MSVPLLVDGGAQRVAVVRALKLGDLLCAVPALRALRAALPRARVTLVGLPWAAAFVEHVADYVDDHLALPGWPGLPEQALQAERIPPFLAEAHRRRFDLAIQMHGNGTLTNPLTVLLGARHSAGYFLPGRYCPDPTRFIAYPDAGPEIHRHLRLMEHLGCLAQGDALEFRVTEAGRSALRRVAPELRPGRYACLHPGSRSARRWPPDLFAAVADDLVSAGLDVVLTGTSDEVDVVGAVARAMRGRALDLAGRTDLGAVAALVADARVLVSNDTGVSHLADALRVPSVVAYLDSDLDRWAPLDRVRHRAIRTRQERDDGLPAVRAAVRELVGAR